MALKITNVTPNYAEANDTVNIVGADFTPGTRVFFANMEATKVIVHNKTHITCKVPPGIGLVNVTVTTP